MHGTVPRSTRSAHPSPIFVFLWVCVILAEALAEVPDAPRATWRPFVLRETGAEPRVCCVVTSEGAETLRAALLRAGLAVGADQREPRTLVLRGPAVSG
jgi:hypothetical protein